MSPSVATRTWGRDSTSHLTPRRPLVALIVLGLVFAALIAPRIGLPAKVPPLTIDNPTAYTLTIEATHGHDRSWAPVAIIGAKERLVETELIDEGPQWRLRFTSQGQTIDGYEVSRKDLAAHGWRYTVPQDVATRLAAIGAPPGP